MEKIKIDRINELARIAKVRELTAEETAERDALRKEYIGEIRASLSGMMDNTYIQRPDGTKEKVKRDNSK